MKKLIYLFAALCLFAVPALAQESTPEATTEPMMETTQEAMVMTEGDATQGLTAVYFVHAAADVGPVDVYISDQPDIPVVADLQFGEMTGEVLIPSASSLFARAAGDDPVSEAMLSLDFDFGGNTTWVVAIVGLNSAGSVLFEPVSVLRNDYNGMSRLRVMNLVATGDSLTASNDMQMDLGTGLAFNGMADNDLEPGTYNIGVTSADGATVFVEPQAFTFNANETNTLLIIGATDGTQPVQVLHIVSPEDTTRVQIINNRTDAIDVHTRPNEEVAVASLAAGETSEFLTLPSGATTFLAFAPGTGPTGQELAGLATTLNPWRDLTIAFEADGQVVVVEEMMTPDDSMMTQEAPQG